MKVTIRTVADLAQVSTATISRVLNEPERVNDQTRERVLEAIRRLDYHPNELAKGLSSRTTNTIGVVVPGITKPFVSELYKGIDQAIFEHKMHALLYDSARTPDSVRDAVLFLKQRQVDGVIISSAYFSEEHQLMVSRLQVPVVLVLTESQKPGMASFKVDDVTAAFDAVKYLIGRGHQRIALIGSALEENGVGQQRYEGYRLALENAGLTLEPKLVELADFRFDSGYAAMEELLARRAETHFTAVFALSDEMAIGAMCCIQDHGLRVPDDISVMGYDNLPVARMVKPRLTTVAQPFEQIGREAVNYLVQLIQNKEHPLERGVRYLPYQIIGRESVTIPHTLHTRD
ncbi:MAG: LacI family DNA-binding transcriptional regulator [Desulfitobacteriaceae bacterium]